MKHDWRAIYEEGRVAWPETSLSLETYRDHVRRLGLKEVPPGFVGVDFFLTCACLAGDPAAVATFDRAYLQAARACIGRVRAHPQFIEDGLQELRKKLLAGPRARLLTFTGRGSLATWVRVAATRLAIDLSRTQRTERQLHRDVTLVEGVSAVAGEVELSLLRKRHAGSFQTSVSYALEQLTAQERNLLRMSVLEGLSIDQIAVPYRVHRATASRWLQAIRTRILDLVRQRMLSENAGMTTEDFESLARTLHSQLHLSLSRVLAADPTSRSS